jgi:membrane associated rhomboid family serine protease
MLKLSLPYLGEVHLLFNAPVVIGITAISFVLQVVETGATVPSDRRPRGCYRFRLRDSVWRGHHPAIYASSQRLRGVRYDALWCALFPLELCAKTCRLSEYVFRLMVYPLIHRDWSHFNGMAVRFFVRKPHEVVPNV